LRDHRNKQTEDIDITAEMRMNSCKDFTCELALKSKQFRIVIIYNQFCLLPFLSNTWMEFKSNQDAYAGTKAGNGAFNGCDTPKEGPTQDKK
jgi:hypothetical protein